MAWQTSHSRVTVGVAPQDTPRHPRPELDLTCPLDGGSRAKSHVQRFHRAADKRHAFKIELVMADY
jgi:hypothetical protein